MKNKRIKKKIARRGEVWSINDRQTRGHNALILKGNKNRDSVYHLPITHATRTSHRKNQKLTSNVAIGGDGDSHILKKVVKSHEKSLGRKNESLKIRNSVDKSIVRNIEKRNKRKR